MDKILRKTGKILLNSKRNYPKNPWFREEGRKREGERTRDCEADANE